METAAYCDAINLTAQSKEVNLIKCLILEEN